MSLSSPWGRATIDARVDLYLAPNAPGASNRNLGTQPELPLATIDEAIARVNAMRGHTAPIVVHIASGAYSISEGVSLKGVAQDAPVVFIGDGAGQAGDDGFTLLDTTSALAGSTAISIVTGLVGTAFAGKTLEFTSGALAGYRRTIGLDDGAGTLTLLHALPAAPGVGDVCRIVEPAAVVTLPAPPVTSVGRFSIYNCGNSNGAPDTFTTAFQLYASTSSVYFVGLGFDGANSLARMDFGRSTAVMHGCEFLNGRGARHFDKSSLLVSGGDLHYPAVVPKANMAANLGFAPDVQAWGGWGLSVFGGPGTGALPGIGHFIGGLYSDALMRVDAGEFYFTALVIEPQDSRAVMALGGSRLTIDARSGVSIARIESNLPGSSRFTIGITDDAFLRLTGNGVVVTRGGGGSCLVVWGENEDSGQYPGRCSVGNGVTFVSEAGSNAHSALCVAGGGRINYRATPTLVGVWDEAEAKVVANEAAPPAAGQGGALAALAARGDAYPDTTVAGAQALVNGIIQRQ